MRRILAGTVVFAFLTANSLAQNPAQQPLGQKNDLCEKGQNAALTPAQKKEYDEKCVGRIPSSAREAAPGAGAATDAAAGGGLSTANIVSILAGTVVAVVALSGGGSKGSTGTR